MSSMDADQTRNLRHCIMYMGNRSIALSYRDADVILQCVCAFSCGRLARPAGCRERGASSVALATLRAQFFCCGRYPHGRIRSRTGREAATRSLPKRVSLTHTHIQAHGVWTHEHMTHGHADVCIRHMHTNAYIESRAYARSVVVSLANPK